MALEAPEPVQTWAFGCQAFVLQKLLEWNDPNWVTTRSLLVGRSINEFEEINGDFANYSLRTLIEFQTHDPAHSRIGWEEDKYLKCLAGWQCFLFYPAINSVIVLMIRTDVLKEKLGPYDKIDWVWVGSAEKRKRVVFLKIEQLQSYGAIELKEWCDIHRIHRSST